MTRLEENRVIIGDIAKEVECNPFGTYEEKVTLQLAVIATMITDMSKSLAILANKAESDSQERKDKE